MPSGSTVAPTNTTLVMNNLVLLADSNSFLLHTQFSSVKMSVMCWLNSLLAIPPLLMNSSNNVSFRSPNSCSIMLLKQVGTLISPKGISHMLETFCTHHRMPGKVWCPYEPLLCRTQQWSQIWNTIIVHIILLLCAYVSLKHWQYCGNFVKFPIILAYSPLWRSCQCFMWFLYCWLWWEVWFCCKGLPETSFRWFLETPLCFLVLGPFSFLSVDRWGLWEPHCVLLVVWCQQWVQVLHIWAYQLWILFTRTSCPKPWGMLTLSVVWLCIVPNNCCIGFPTKLPPLGNTSKECVTVVLPRDISSAHHPWLSCLLFWVVGLTFVMVIVCVWFCCKWPSTWCSPLYHSQKHP